MTFTGTSLNLNASIGIESGHVLYLDNDNDAFSFITHDYQDYFYFDNDRSSSRFN